MRCAVIRRQQLLDPLRDSTGHLHGDCDQHGDAYQNPHGHGAAVCLVQFVVATEYILIFGATAD
ncbi:MAG TPA: hypothetical protein VE442_09070 [Jatrophihabitans sp.]|nr:hypothetical protein [Jatrophihabitans sp.]